MERLGAARREWLRFDVHELTGALGDTITVLPIVVALGVLTPLSLPHVLFCFGLFQLVWGVVYGLPMSVEPMKALAGLAIAGSITAGELAAAGLLAGVTLLGLGYAGAIGRLRTVIGAPVIRGVQFAVALLLALTGLELIAGDPSTALAATLVAAVALGAGFRRASAPLVLALGGGVAVWTAGVPAPTLPESGLFAGVRPELTVGAAEGAVAQLGMTVGNAALATALLCSELFDRRVDPDALSTSMGAMCLSAVPLGGLPMCHGSGGLAGKHTFGARTGGANIILGAGYLAAATVAGVVLAFPLPVLGVLLLIVAWDLGSTALRTESVGLVVAVGVLGALANVGVAFVLGAVGYRLLTARR
ncbi:putative sulfate/molybdate transporter [Haloferacaceae archaeon DSL9]